MKMDIQNNMNSQSNISYLRIRPCDNDNEIYLNSRKKEGTSSFLIKDKLNFHEINRKGFQTISNRISVKITVQMRSAGEFTSILHRCCRMVFLWNFKIFMFIGKQWSFWYVLEQFLTNFRCKLWHRCVSQGNLPWFCIGALTRCCSSKCNDPRVYEKRRCYRRVSQHNRAGLL